MISSVDPDRPRQSVSSRFVALALFLQALPAISQGIPEPPIVIYGVVTDAEKRDLHAVAKLLGEDEGCLDAILADANSKLLTTTTIEPAADSSTPSTSLAGKRVCFTGELQSTLKGAAHKKRLAKALADASAS